MELPSSRRGSKHDDNDESGRQSQNKERNLSRKHKHKRQIRSSNQHNLSSTELANPRATAAAAAVVMYASIRGGIKAFHLTRRCFLRQTLVDLIGALRSLQQIYWLDFGSLLGIYRDGDLIAHDNDIDMVVLEPQWQEFEAQLKSKMRQTSGKNYNIALVTPSEDPTATFMRVYCPLAFADVFGAKFINDKKLLVDCGHGDVTSIAADIVLPVGTIEWRGAEIAVPGKLEDHLEQRYGSNWKTPIYMDKGADVVEHEKTYAKVFRALSKIGIRL